MPKNRALEVKQEGNHLFISGNYAAAAKKYSEAIDLDPSATEFYSNLCNCLSKLEQYEEMEAIARSCVELNASYVKGHYWLVNSFKSRNRHRDALQIADKAIESLSTNASMSTTHVQDLQKLRNEIAEHIDKNKSLENLMESCNLVPSKDSMGNTILVSKGLSQKKFTNDDGSLNLGKVINNEAPSRGICAFPGCDVSSDDQKLNRCTGCWEVDYCSRGHQKADWKRHKKHECKVKKNINNKKRTAGNESGDQKSKSPSSHGWQASVFEARRAMKKKEYTSAIELLNTAEEIEEGEITKITLMRMKAECNLQKGNTTKALECAYIACKRNHADVIAMVVKAKCHMKLNNIEAAYMSCYSAYNALVLRVLNTNEKSSLEQKHIMPLIQELTRDLIPHLLKRRQPVSESSFPMKVRIASVPFTMDCRNGQAQIMQDYMGLGFHLYRPQSKCASFPMIQQHTTVRYGSCLVVFGGFDGQISRSTNAVRTVELVEETITARPKYLYSHATQDCTGDVPPPTQGHAACVLGDEMFVFGGEALIDGMYVLNMKHWVWRKEGCMSNAPVDDRPDTHVLFSSLVPLNSTTLLLLGGVKNEAMESARTKQTPMYGLSALKDGMDPSSSNAHLYSIETDRWSPLNVNGDAPKGWDLQSHHIDENKVLVFCVQHHTFLNNSLHLLSKSEGGVFEWTKYDENLGGTPPPLSWYRATSWVKSSNCLILFGGRHLHYNLEDSVLKLKNTENDCSCTTFYDQELYCFNLKESRWLRLRVPQNCLPRASHTMNVLNGNLVVLGGSSVANGVRGYRDERDYATDVTCFNLDLSEVHHGVPVGETKAKKTGNGKKGKRRGKKKR